MLIFFIDFLSYFFGIVVFEDKVFWIDLENEVIFSVNWFNGLEIFILVENFNNLYDIVIFYELKQLRVLDVCELSVQFNGGCEYLCFFVFQIFSYFFKYICVCFDIMWLGLDMKRCY